MFVLGASWSACSIDDRDPGINSGGTGGQVNSLLGGSGGADPQGPSVGSITVEPSSIELGPVVMGSPARARLRIANTGNVAIGAPSVTLPSGGPAFSVIQNLCDSSLLPGQSLPPGQSCEVRVQLLADRAGSIGGQLAIEAAGSTWNVPLAAQGNTPGSLILAPAAGSSENFGSVRLGTSTQAVFNLTNPGTTASGPVSVHLYNGDVTVVTGAPGACVSGVTSLEAGQTCDVNLAFGPSHRGPSDALVVVTSDVAGSVGLPLRGRGIVAGVLAVSQRSLDFDGVVLGDSGDRALRVINQGDEPLSLLGVTLEGAQSAEFSIQSSDCTSGRTLAAGSGCDVITEFRPATSGDAKNAALTIAMSGGASQVVALAGAGLDEGSLTVAPLEGNLADFGALALGAERTQAFRVVNGSAQTSGPLAISASGDFTLVPPSQPEDCQSGQTSLEQTGASCNVTVKLVPQRRAAQFGSLSIRSPLAKSTSLRLLGTGMAPARLSLVQDEVNFGRVLSGGTYQAAVTVQNQGDQPLEPPAAALQDSFGAEPAGFSLENGCTAALGYQASCAVNVRFQPTVAGFPVALLRVESPTGGAASTLLFGEVELAGTLVLAVAAGESADFGDVGIQTPKTVNFTLTNPSATPSGRLSITASSPLFAIDPGTCNPVGSSGLANNETCTFSVTYRPLLAEAVSATLSIRSPGAGGAALSLTGQGRSPANLVAEGNRDFATANIGQAAATDPRNDFTWALRNEGDLATGTLQITNSNSVDFAVAADGCGGQVLSGHTGCDVSLRFRPGMTGPRSGDLVVTDTASGQITTLKMTGNGVQIAQPGESCVNADCAPGSTCTGNVCCDRPCASGCQQCSPAGVCIDQDNRERCGNGSGVCFGVDQCLLPEGQTCSGDNQCGSNNCELRLNGAGARVCCLENCAPGNQCGANGQGCQAPTLAEGSLCGGAGDLPCANGLVCKECSTGGSRCTPPTECCGDCPGDQVCGGGTCGCPGGTVDCQDTRCIADRAGACCDSNGCDGNKTCSATTDLCGCPATAPKDCGGNRCIPNAQCCDCTGLCQTCNNGTCSPVASGQPGRCQNGQVCNQNGACAAPAPVGVGAACNVQANNCSGGSTCQGGFCSCLGTNTPNACGTRCVNQQNDAANCGACGVACGALGCTGGVCNCPAGQQFANGACRGVNGQTCTTAAQCVNGCTMWFRDGDLDGFGAGAAQGRCGPNSPPTGGNFVTRGGDCCDSEANAFPGQTLRFGEALPAACVGSAAADHDWNCNGRNEGALTVNCAARSQANCAAGNGVSGQLVGDIVPVPQVDVPDPTPGVLLCGRSVGPGTCQFFTAANPASAQGLGQGQCDVGCCPARIGFSQLPCN